MVYEFYFTKSVIKKSMKQISIAIKTIKLIILKPTENPKSGVFISDFFQMFKKEATLILP